MSGTKGYLKILKVSSSRSNAKILIPNPYTTCYSFKTVTYSLIVSSKSTAAEEPDGAFMPVFALRFIHFRRCRRIPPFRILDVLRIHHIRHPAVGLMYHEDHSDVCKRAYCHNALCDVCGDASAGIADRANLKARVEEEALWDVIIGGPTLDRISRSLSTTFDPANEQVRSLFCQV